MSNDDAHFRLRIPRHLKEWVEENAKANNRSINAEILSCLEFVKGNNFKDTADLMREVDRKIDEYMKPFYEKLDNLKTEILKKEK